MNLVIAKYEHCGVQPIDEEDVGGTTGTVVKEKYNQHFRAKLSTLITYLKTTGTYSIQTPYPKELTEAQKLDPGLRDIQEKWDNGNL